MAELQRRNSRPTIGWLWPSVPRNEYLPSPRWAYLEAFEEGLRKGRYTPGVDVDIAIPPDRVEGMDLKERADRILQAATPPKVIVAVATSATLVAAEALRERKLNIPIVTVAAGDFEMIRANTNGAANITGITSQFPDLVSQRLALLKEVLPDAARLGILHNSSNPAKDKEKIETEQAAIGLGMTPYCRNVEDPADFAKVMQAFTESDKVQALVVLTDPLTIRYRRRVVQLAALYQLPAIYGLKEFVAGGGLLSYGPDFPALYRRAASFFVSAILNGTPVADLPPEPARNIELSVNLETAARLKVNIPQSVLSQVQGDSLMRWS